MKDRKIILVCAAVLAAAVFAVSALGAGTPLLQAGFSQNPVSAAPGSDGYVQMTLNNAGSSGIYSIKVASAAGDGYVSADSSAIGSLGSLGAGQSAAYLFKFSVSGSASSGLHPLSFTIDYCSDTSGCAEINPSAIISVQSPSALQIVSVAPSTLSAGETTTLGFNLKNSGADAISNIVLSWQMPNNEILPLGTGNRQIVSNLEAGASISIPVNVSVGPSVSPGAYPMTVSLQYIDKSGAKQNVTASVGINIGGATQFDAGVQDTSSGTTSLSIANIGVNPATSVSVSIPEQQDFAASGASSVFLGNLNPGDFGIASFQIFSRGAGQNAAGQNAAGQNGFGTGARASPKNLTVEISYSDTSGTRQAVDKQIPLSLAASTFQGSGMNGMRQNGGLFGYLPYIVVVIIAVALLAWFFKFRKRKKKV